MPLTPADVHNVAFKKPSIGKRGYDEDEVDAFLDVVEAELSRLIEENAELTAHASELDGASGQARRTTSEPRPAEPDQVQEAPVPVATGNGHVQAARLLGLAQETADKLTAEAKTEADRLLADATSRADAAERDSRAKAEALDSEAKARYDEVLGKLSDDRVGLEKKIADLRSYERDYRSRLKSWISDQLAQLDGEGKTAEQVPAVVAGPGE